MWTIILILFIGVLLGRSNLIPENLLKYNSKLQHIGVIFLLFAMGITIGTNKSIIKNISSIGFKSFSYALIISIICIVFVYLFSNFFMKEDTQ